MGLGLLLFGLMAGGSAIKCGIENAKMMSKPYRYMDDGTPVYLDRLCNEHINGEKVISKYNYQKGCMQDVGERSGRVYYDEQDVQRKRFDDWNERNRQDAIKKGQLAYLKYNPIFKKELTCEISTGKFIAKIVGNNLFEEQNPGKLWGILENPEYPREIAARPEYRNYRKFYLDPNGKSVSDTIPGDEGIPITVEEFDKLNIVCGTHFAWDSYRDDWGRTPEHKDYNYKKVYIGCR